ncbi:MAG: restriction endonuclease subunit S [Candidatus Paceibacterota bacterium]|jgi:type I restriction enzyme S subunit
MDKITKHNWQTKKLGEVCEFQNGFAFKSKLFKEDGFPILRISNIQSDGISYNRLVFFDKNSYKDNFDRYQVLKGDLVIAMSGATTGKLAISDADEAFYLNQRVGKFKPKKDLSKDYLYYFLSTRIEENLRISAGSAQPNLSTEQIKYFKIPLPSLPEQQRIVKILDEVFEKTAKAKENAEKNLQNAKELFESYLQSVFANPGKNWERKKLGDVCGFVRGPFGGSLKKNIFKKEGYAVYEQQHAIYNQFDKIRYFIDEKKFQEMSRFELKPNELIMSCSGTMGKIAIAPENIKKGIINQALLKLNPNKYLLNVFLSYWIKSSVFQYSLEGYSKGAAIKNVVSVKILKEIGIFIPPLDEQRAIVRKIDAFSMGTKKLEGIYEQKLADLEELKKSILKEAFNGRL